MAPAHLKDKSARYSAVLLDAVGARFEIVPRRQVKWCVSVLPGQWHTQEHQPNRVGHQDDYADDPREHAQGDPECAEHAKDTGEHAGF
jgi:hypothetical protein